MEDGLQQTAENSNDHNKYKKNYRIFWNPALWP